MLAVEDKLEIMELIARYNLASDERDVDAFLACYTADAVITGHMQTRQGQTAMREDLPKLFAMEGTLKRHLTLNFQLSGDNAAAEVRYLLLVVEGETMPSVVATSRITDQLRKVDGAWRVVRHDVQIDPAMFNAFQAQQSNVTSGGAL